MKFISISAVISSAETYENRDGDNITAYNHILYGLTEDGKIYWRKEGDAGNWKLDDSGEV